MKVLFISTDFPYVSDKGTLTQGGGGACISQLAQALHEKGVIITVITRNEPGIKKELYDFPIHRTSFLWAGFRESKITHMLPATLEAIKKLDDSFDIVHSHNPVAGVSGCIASKLYSIPHVMTLHGPWSDVRQNPLTRAVARVIEGFSVKTSDAVTCDSRALKKDIDSYYDVSGKTLPIPNAVDTDFFTPKASTKKNARAKLGIKTDKPIVLYTGRFVEEKGLPYLLEASKSVDDAHFLLLGGGFDEHLVSSWMKNNPKADNITTIPYLPYEKMPYAYLSSDVFVLPTLAEGMSRSILEAMSCGLPIVATDVGGNPELVKDNGVLVPSRDSEAIAQALDKVFKNPNMGASSRQRVLSEFTVEKRLNSFIKVYKSLV